MWLKLQYTVTGQLVNTPTHGLATHALDNSWMPLAVAALVVITLIYGHKTLHQAQHVLGAISMLG